MTNKQLLGSLAALAVLAIIFGTWASYTNTPATTSAVPALSSVVGGELASDGVYRYTERSACFSIDVEYPATTSLAAAADVRARTTMEQRLLQDISEFKANNDVSGRSPEQVEALGMCADRPFTLKIQYETRSGSGTISYLYTVFADSLGAHPNGYFITFVFNDNGELLGLEQVLGSNQNWLEELSLLVSRIVTAQMAERLGPDAPQGAEGPDVTGALFAEGLAPKEENFRQFIVDGDDLLIIIPPYQVAAYAMGSFEARIPLADLQ